MVIFLAEKGLQKAFCIKRRAIFWRDRFFVGAVPKKAFGDFFSLQGRNFSSHLCFSTRLKKRKNL